MKMKKSLAVMFSLCLLAAAAPRCAAEGSAPAFQLRLYGGLSYLTGGDVNDGVGGIFQAYAAQAAAYGYSTSGGFNAAHLGLGFGGDFIFQITPNIGIGVGAGYLRATKDSTLTLTAMGNSLTLGGTPQFNAVPLKLGLFFSFPMSPSLNFNFNIGAGYYMAKMTSVLHFAEGANIEELDNDAKANGLGFQGGIGFDYRIGSGVSLFVEAQGQVANFGGFTGTSTESGSGSSTFTDSGKLYYYDNAFFPPATAPFIMVKSTPPTGSWVFNVREAKVNFTGGQVVLGILFKI
jgi:hypothetical protein